jgi:hypothetical protein
MTNLTDSTEIAEGIVAWAREQIPELEAGYPHPIGNTAGVLPDVVAVVQSPRIVRGPSDAFPLQQLEQSDRIEFDIEVSIMVEAQGEGVDAEKAAHQQLESFAHTLMGSTLADPTLGSRVPVTSPFSEADLSTPFQERPDGSRGRTLFLNLTVADAVEIDL